jgi:hypothetical protein
MKILFLVILLLTYSFAQDLTKPKETDLKANYNICVTGSYGSGCCTLSNSPNNICSFYSGSSLRLYHTNNCPNYTSPAGHTWFNTAVVTRGTWDAAGCIGWDPVLPLRARSYLSCGENQSIRSAFVTITP